MKYDPDAPPFWEQARGFGPCLKMQAMRRKALLRAALSDLQQEISIVKVYDCKKELPELLELRNNLLLELNS